MTKILLDTDIGSEVDDAACLAYLIAEPRSQLLGITTVGGDPRARAGVAQGLLAGFATYDVPIYPGAGRPLVVEPLERRPRQQVACASGAAVYGGEIDRENEAVPFLAETIRRHPGEVTLLSVGPLTNVALLFALAPEIPALLKAHIMVCGDFSDREDVEQEAKLEWNARNDPHAAAFVYRAWTEDSLTFGQDSAGLAGLTSDEILESFRSPILHWVAESARGTTGLREFTRLDDAVAAVAIFEPSIYRAARGEISYRWADPRYRAIPAWTAAANGRHRLARSVDHAMFFQKFFAAFPGDQPPDSQRSTGAGQ